MAIEPYQFEQAPEARLDVPMNVAPRVISRDRFCLECGYNVRGLRIDENCPECGRAILAKEPVPSGAPAAAASFDDANEVRRCEGCGYDLRGLPLAGVCPECGLPKSMPSGASFIDPLSRMPIAIIRRFRTATIVVSIVMLVGIVLLVRAMLGMAAPVPSAVFLLTTSAGWFGAVWLATPAMNDKPAIARGFTSQSWLRLAARTMQMGWIVAAGCTLVIVSMPAAPIVPAEAFVLLRWIGVAIGLAGVWCFALMMGNLAEWARDDFAERIFNLSLWGIPLGTPPLLFVNVGSVLGWSYAAMMMRGPMAVVALLLWMAWMLALLTFPLAMLSLTKSVALSANHNREHHERQRRQEARRVEYDERVTESIDKLNPHPRK